MPRSSKRSKVNKSGSLLKSKIKNVYKSSRDMAMKMLKKGMSGSK